jgi:hypothetical protein
MAGREVPAIVTQGATIDEMTLVTVVPELRVRFISSFVGEERVPTGATRADPSGRWGAGAA